MGKLDQSSLKLLKGMLRLDPAKRLSAAECLESEWFDDIREESVD